MTYQETALSFRCQNTTLYGVLSLPLQPAERGVLFIVGGPQYRAGSHRQFTLLARQFAAQGVAVMRFDYRGMGDSDGEQRDFNGIDDDIRAAITCFFEQATTLREVVLWGLCDGASAALFYANQDHRVCGLVLVNPWVRTDESIAKAYLRHYYLQRLFNPELWRKLGTGRFNPADSALSFMRQIRQLTPFRREPGISLNAMKHPDSTLSLPEKMRQGFSLFQGRILFILCSDDLTAQEFSDLAGGSGAWRKLMSRRQVTCHDLALANHTFSQRHWREQIGRWTLDWLKAW